MWVVCASMNFPASRWFAMFAHLAAALLAGWGVCAESVEPKPGIARFSLETWQADKGLPGNIVSAIAQTPDGYIWFGTDQGLARFNGTRFKVFLPPDSQPGPERQILALCVDRGGRLWFANAAGKLGLAGQRGLEPLPAGLPDFASPVIALAADPAGGLWILEAAGRVSRFVDGDFRRMEDCPGATGMVVDGGGAVWISTASSMLRHRAGRWDEMARGMPILVVAGARRAGGVWLVAGSRLQSVDSNGRIGDLGAVPWTEDGITVRQVFEDASGALWIGTNRKGLYRFADGAFQSVPSAQNNIFCIAQDVDENMWIGLQGGGVNRLHRQLFVTLERGLTNEIVYSVAQDAAGRIWASTLFGGLGFIADNHSWRPLAAEQGWPGVDATCLSPTPDGRMWIGTLDRGLFYWKNDRILPYEHGGKLPPSAIMALFADRGGRLWAGFSTAGLACIESDGVKLYGKEQGLPEDDVRAVVEDVGGSLWIGMGGRGSLAFLRDGRFEALPQHLCPGFPIRTLCPSGDGALWIGTVSGGLFRLKDAKLSRITAREGLPGDTVSQLLLDGDGNLWGGTDQGLFRAALRNLNAVADGRARFTPLEIFDRSDGLQAMQFMGGFQPVAWKARDGTFWMASVKGLVFFHPARIPPLRQAPKMVIEELRCNGQPVAISDNIRLAAGVEDLEIHFASPGFGAPGRLRFRHKLEGVDTDWRDGGGSSVANYRNLPPGRHLFRVGIADTTSDGHEGMASLAFAVAPRFWQTTWFLILAGSVATAGVASAVRYGMVRRLRRKLQTLEQREAVERERMRIARDLHDDVGSNLSSIVLLSQISEPPSPADVSDIRRIASETIDSLRDIVWFINPAFDSLSDMVVRMEAATNDLLHGIPHEFQSERIPPDVKLSPIFRRNVFPAFKETLHNAAHHARASEVEVAIRVAGGNFEFCVSDNGIGFVEAGVKLGNGLRSLRRRAADLGGEVTIESRPGHGTRVTFAAPLT